MSLMALSLVSSATFAQGMSAQITDKAWSGEKLPEGMQCQKFGGKNPHSPSMQVKGIPQGANLLLVEFSDRSYQKMNNGGYGKVAYALNAGQTTLDLPQVPGHSFDLPLGFMTVQAQINPNWDKAGAYLPPCSGGRGNTYEMTLKAVQFDGDSVKVLDSVDVHLGKY